MKRVLAFAIVLGSTFAAGAEEAGLQQAPDLTGTWVGKARAVIFGQNAHHPGSQTVNDPPRVEEVTFTYEFEKQDGRLMWGTVWSDPTKKEPIALAFSFDNGTILGADTDGYHRLTIISETRLEACFTMNGLSPTGSIVASCWIAERQPK